MWDDLRFFLALARVGRLTSAARTLKVDHTTVARRLQALEAHIGVPLFKRTQSGYQLTEAGKLLVSRAETMEVAYLESVKAFPNAAEQVSGIVRIGCTEAYGTTILPRHVVGLMKAHPGLDIEIIAVPRPIQLPKHEADIVITIDRPERGPYKIVRLSDYRLLLYASGDYLSGSPQISCAGDLTSHVFVNYIEDLALAKGVPSPRALAGSVRTPLRSTSIIAQRTAAEAGGGIAILPCFLVGKATGLLAVLPREIELTRTYWMLSPVKQFETPRVRATWDFLRLAAEEEQSVLMGEASADFSPHPEQ